MGEIFLQCTNKLGIHKYDFYTHNLLNEKQKYVFDNFCVRLVDKEKYIKIH